MGRLRIGLTGGIGSGKSTVASALQDLGAQPSSMPMSLPVS